MVASDGRRAASGVGQRLGSEKTARWRLALGGRTTLDRLVLAHRRRCSGSKKARENLAAYRRPKSRSSG
jgi:hypothetical protein